MRILLECDLIWNFVIYFGITWLVANLWWSSYFNCVSLYSMLEWNKECLHFLTSGSGKITGRSINTDNWVGYMLNKINY